MKRIAPGLIRLLVVALFLLSSRTPSIASISPFGGNGKQPKPGKRALPAASARTLVKSIEKPADGLGPVSGGETTGVEPAAWGLQGAAEPDLTRPAAPESLRPFGTSPPRTGLAPPATNA